ncbi:LIC_13387 family protein [Sorangium sp. So ce1151]|uniref:LIC_13387 family protein n=1 Tax=Sorangium sp. So ce1151 TaxID=3133332 RepID=UPI003F60FBBF
MSTRRPGSARQTNRSPWCVPGANWSLALLAIAVRAFPPPPIVTMLVATACFGAALVVR